MNTISTRTGSYYGDATHNHIFEIHDAEGLAADLYIDTTHKLVVNIEVRENRRGEGLASTLYEYANTTLGTVYHMPVWACTAEGAAFAAAVGGETIDETTAAEYAGIDLDTI